MNVRVDNNALLKLFLHTIKYSSNSVNGLLVGRCDDDCMHIIDAIPLFHTILTISPPLEIALALVEEKLKSMEVEMAMIGVYTADAHLDKAELDNASKTIAEKIAQHSTEKATCLLIMEGHLFASMMKGENQLPFKLYMKQKNEPNWENCEEKDILTHRAQNVRELLEEMLERNLHTKIADFDEHLDDSRKYNHLLGRFYLTV